MRQRHIALFAALLLAGCASKPPVTGICPLTGFIDNTDTVTYFMSQSGTAADTSEDNVAVRGSINGYRGSCSFADKKKDAVEIDLKVPFVAQKGPAGKTLTEKTFPYFIAVLSPDGKILTRTAFTTTVKFDKDETATRTEDHSINIPLPPDVVANGDGAEDYKVIVGFALSRAQYAYNKERKK